MGGRQFSFYFESQRRAVKKIECTENADSTIRREVETYRQVLPIGTRAYPYFGTMKLLELLCTSFACDGSPLQFSCLQVVRFPNNSLVAIYTPGWTEAL